MLVTEKTGGLVLVKNTTATTITTIQVCSGGEMGLLGVVPDPNFASNGFVYLYRTKPAPGGCGSSTNRFNQVVRIKMVGDSVQSGSLTELLTGIRTDGSNHNGGVLRIGPDQKLYVGVGDTGIGDGGPPGASTNPYAQPLSALEGKVLRLELDGTPAAGNPFIGTPGARGEIYARGFRNPWRFDFDPQTGSLWLGDVGQSTIEEVDIVVSGGNYAWPRCEGTLPVGCQQAGDIDPIFEYPHSGTGTLGDSITGGSFAGPGFGAYAGHYIFGDYVAGNLYNATPNAARNDITGSPSTFVTGASGPVDIVFGPGGALYYAAINVGEVRRVAQPCEGVSASIIGSPGDDNLTGTTGDDVIVGLGGDDTISGLGGNDKICGDDGVDRILGGAGDDTISGMAGNDNLTGDSGADTLKGGSGVDTASYASRMTGVTVDIDNAADDGNSDDGPAGARDNVSTDIENLTGGRGADTLTGGTGNNTLDGRDGADVLNGLAGVDTASYASRTTGVTVDIDDVADDGNSSDGPVGARDNVKPDIEKLIGGKAGDTLTGSASNNTLDGRDGPDLLSGLGGTDAASYAASSSGVTVDIDGVADDGNAADGPAGARDNVMTDIEALTGGKGADTLTGSAANNRLTGGLGADALIGLNGNDTLFANDGTADSTLDCDGGSNDTAHVDGADPPPVGCETVVP